MGGWPLRISTKRGERGALQRRLARNRRKHHLRADVDREHVGVADAGALGDSLEFLDIARMGGSDRLGTSSPFNIREDAASLPAFKTTERSGFNRCLFPSRISFST